MRSIDIPNGFVVIGMAGLPVLIDFDEGGEAIDKGVELSSDGWLGKGRMGPDVLALVHSVKGEESILIKALLVVKLSLEGKLVTAVSLGKTNRLSNVAKKIRSNFIKDIEKCEKNPKARIPNSYHLTAEDMIE
jgi:hypothetical protein